MSIDITAQPRIEFLDANGNPLSSATGALVFTLPDYGLMFESAPLHASTHEKAMQVAAARRVLGFGNWRASRRKELELLIDPSQSQPATWPVLAEITPTDDLYWTADPVTSDSGSAWYVAFSNGYVNYFHRLTCGLVRAVRSVPPSQ